MVTYISRAQNFEDYRLFRALKHLDNGNYVDIGSWDPCYHSISFNFYQSGWRGVNVEPQRESYVKLESERREDINLWQFVSSREGKIEFLNVEKSGLSTGNVVQTEKLRLDSKYKGILETIETITLAEVLNHIDNGQIHWLKIDVEGSEEEVLKSWGNQKARPWIVVVEATEPSQTKKSETPWEGYLFERNYHFTYFDGLNNFYLHENHMELAESLAQPISIFDDVIKYEEFTLRSSLNQILQRVDKEKIAIENSFLGQPESEILAQTILEIMHENKTTRNEIFQLEEETHKLKIEKTELQGRLNILRNDLQRIERSKTFRYSFIFRTIYYRIRYLSVKKYFRNISRFIATYFIQKKRIKYFLIKYLPGNLIIWIKLKISEDDLSGIEGNTNTSLKVWDPEMEYLIDNTRDILQ
jgi:FkbM family methyltransferase